MSGTQMERRTPARRASATDATISLWYALGVVAPLALAASTPWWNWRVGGVAWVVALVLLMLANVRFDVEFEERNPVARRWRVAAVVLLVVTAVVGMLALLLYLFAFFLAQVANGL